MKKNKILLLLCASPFIYASAYASATLKNEVVLTNASTNNTAYAAYSKDTKQVGTAVKPGSAASQFILKTTATSSTGTCNTKTYDFNVKSSDGAAELCTFKFKVQACNDDVFGIKFVHGEITHLQNSVPKTPSFDLCSVKWTGVGKSHGSGYYDSGKMSITVKTSTAK